VRRTWKHGLIATALVASPAWAFHAGSQFDKTAGAGGGAGLFYTGSHRERGWTCAACHVDAQNKIKVQLAVQPNLFDGFRYAPNQVYAFTATLVGEWKGLDSPRANYNGFSLEVTDLRDRAAGSMGYSPTELYGPSQLALVTSIGTQPNKTTWTFSWTAPPAGTGTIRINLAAVDGNGADSGANGTLTDPFGDDVFTAMVEIQER
jgi:hypothetical protein